MHFAYHFLVVRELLSEFAKQEIHRRRPKTDLRNLQSDRSVQDLEAKPSNQSVLYRPTSVPANQSVLFGPTFVQANQSVLFRLTSVQANHIGQIDLLYVQAKQIAWTDLLSVQANHIVRMVIKLLYKVTVFGFIHKIGRSDPQA